MLDEKMKITKKPIQYEWLKWLKPHFTQETLAILEKMQEGKDYKKKYTSIQIYNVMKGYSGNMEILKALKTLAQQRKNNYEFNENSLKEPLD